MEKFLRLVRVVLVSMLLFPVTLSLKAFEVKAEDKVGLLNKIGRKFSLYQNLILKLQGTIVPVLSVDELMNQQKIVVATLNLDVSGSMLCVSASTLKVPQGHRWKLIYARKGTTTANSSVLVVRGGVTCKMMASGTIESYTNCYGIHLYAGDEIGLEATDDAGDTAREIRVVYQDDEY